MNKVIEYIKETKSEMSHVSWPTRKQALGYTIAVAAISIAIALYLGVFDSIFSMILDRIILGA